MKNTFKKNEHLKSLNAFKALFAVGTSNKHFPIRMVFTPWQNGDNVMIQAGFSVSKKKFKNAVDRNFIKRQMREAYRLNKNELLTNLQQPYAVLFIYLHHQNSPYAIIETALQKCMVDLAKYDADKMKAKR